MVYVVAIRGTAPSKALDLARTDFKKILIVPTNLLLLGRGDYTESYWHLV